MATQGMDDQERSNYLAMLNNITQDLDMLLTDMCHICPFPDESISKGQKLTFSEPPEKQTSDTSTDSGTYDQRTQSSSLNSSQQDECVPEASNSGLQIPGYHYHDNQGEDPAPKFRNISTVERLTKTHTIWFLPDIGRAGAVHLLKDKDAGAFIVRNSSQDNTLALSIQSPQKGVANVDHYLIESTESGLRVQGSPHAFTSIQHLVSHYCTNNDNEISHKLVLPKVLAEATSSHELTALGMLGQNFWNKPVKDFNHKSTNSLSAESHNLQKSSSEPISIVRAVNVCPSNVKEPTSSQPFSSLNSLSCPLHRKSYDFDKLKKLHDCQNIGLLCNNNEDGVTNNESSHLVQHSNDDSMITKEFSSSSTQTDESNCQQNNSQEDLMSNVHKSYKSFHQHSVGKSVFYVGNELSVSQSSSRTEDNNTVNSSPQLTARSGTSSNTQQNMNTHPKMSEKKSNLYFTTSLDLLNIPETSYFHSELCDKMSDYEDIWRSATPSIQGADSHHDIANNITQKCLHAARLSKLETLHNNLNIVENSTGKVVLQKVPNMQLINLNDAPTLVMSEENEESKSREAGGSDSVQLRKIPPPLQDLSRPKYSSTNSLTNIKSPIYVEPCDAIKNVHNVKSAVRVRRKSAPSMTCKELRKQNRLSQNRTLETIVSPGNSDPESSDKFVFSERVTSQNCKFSELLITKRPNNQEYLSNYPVTSAEFHEVSEKKEVFKMKEDQDDATRLKLKNIDSDMMLLNDLSDGTPASPSLNKFPVYDKRLSVQSMDTVRSESTTVEDMISNTAPQFSIKPVHPLTFNNFERFSHYDNLNNRRTASMRTTGSSGTEFQRPWDSSLWQKLLKHSDPKDIPHLTAEERIKAWQIASVDFQKRNEGRDSKRVSLNSNISESSVSDISGIHPLSKAPSDEELPPLQTPDTLVLNGNVSSLERTIAGICSRVDDDEDNHLITGHTGDDLGGYDFRTQLTSVLTSPRLLHQKDSNPGGKIRDFVYRLSQDRDTTFGSTIENFIKCTVESHETNPYNTMRNVRQFMNGIKNYLLKHGEGQLEDLIETERNMLDENEFLNMDAIIESALHVCVIRPLKQYIYKLLIDEHTQTGNLKVLSTNIKLARNKTAYELGVKKEVTPPHGSSMDVIREYLNKMQKSYSPLKKLENLLGATSSIYKAVSDCSKAAGRSACLGADDFLPMLIYVIVHCGAVAAEIEADYMWGLLHPSLLTGEGGYYLTTMSSAVLVLKNMGELQLQAKSPSKGRLPSISDLQGFLKIAIPDELRENIIWKTLPVRPNMTTKDVCTLIAHKFKITNPQDYGLFLLVNGEEKTIADNVCPQVLKGDYLSKKQQECVFAYKRTAANIAWPNCMKGHKNVQ